LKKKKEEEEETINAKNKNYFKNVPCRGGAWGGVVVKALRY
jgi:hypothetical protein